MDSWAYFDHIYCINLNTRGDRRNTVNKLFTEYNIPVTYYVVDPHPTSGIQGCFESHTALINEAYKNNYDNILIFEDDVVATPYCNAENLKASIQFMQNNNEWEIFYFSMAPEIFWRRIKHVNGNIYKVHAYWGSAYVLSRKGIEHYYNLKYNGTEIDCIYRDNNYAYGHCPSFFYQHNEQSSDLRAYNKSYNGNCPNMVEWYALNINVPAYWFLVILIIIFLIALIFAFLYKI